MAGEEAAKGAGANPTASFLERKQAQLAAETSAAAPEATASDEDTQEGITDELAESEEHETGALDVDPDDDDTEDTDEDGITDGEDDDEEDEPLAKQLADTQTAFHEAREELRKTRNEQAEAMGELTRGRFALDDTLTEATAAAKYWVGLAEQQVMQARNIDLSRVPQEQYAQVQQQVRAAEMQYQQTQQQLRKTLEFAKEQQEAALQREAQVARTILDRRIDNFGDEYPKIAAFAKDRGVNPAVFERLTDPGLVTIVHEAMKAAEAGDSVEEIKRKPKTKKHRSKLTTQQPRDAKGKYRKARRDFEQSTDPKARKAAWLAGKKTQL